MPEPGSREPLNQTPPTLDGQESNERFALAILGANDGLWDWNLQTGTVYYSPRWKSMLGYEDHEIPNQLDEWLKHIHPEDVERAQATFQAYIEGRLPTYEMELCMRHKDGSYRQILTRGAALRDENGQLLRVAGWHTDITEYKRTSSQLYERDVQYRSIFEAASDGFIISSLDGVIVEANPAACQMTGASYEELIGQQPAALLHPDYRYLIAQFTKTIKAGGHFQVRAVSVRKDGGTFPVEIHGTPFIYRGAPHILAVVRNITEQVQAEQLLEQRVRERTHELSTLLAVSKNITSTIELQPLLGLILDQLKTVIDYNGATLSALEQERLTLLDYRGPIPTDRHEQLRHILEGLVARERLFEHLEPVIIPDVRDPGLATPEAPAPPDDAAWTLYPHTRCWMGVPLAIKGHAIGLLSFSHAQPGYYTQQHARLARAIANQVAVALENAQLYKQAQELAAMEERQRLARELHDSVSQALYGIALGAHTARALLDRDPSQMAGPLDYILSLAEAGLAEMRALIFELRPESLENEGLVAALTKQADALHARNGIIVNSTLGEEPAAPLDAKQALYRIAQEALHNTVKHARASQVDLHLSAGETALTLTVTDNGQGFNPTGEFPGHLGLRSMRERATRLGGSLEIESAPGRGTRLLAQIPLRAH